MLSLLDIAERSQQGPRMDERAWDMGLFRTMGALAKKYDIQFPSEHPFVNLDDTLPPRAFEAAVEFLATAGVYCVSTGRVILFTEAEIRQAAREAPTRVIVGEGRDQRVITQKKVEGTEPLNHCPGHHAPWSEELAPLVVKNFAQIPSGDYLEGFNFAVVDGREIFGMPMEAYAARREVAWLREGIRKAGRPGMAIAYYPINTRAAVLLAPIDPISGLRRTDGILLGVLPDVKVEHDLLTAAIVYEDYGSFRVNGGGVAYIGGFCGGTEGAIIEAIAKSLAGVLVYHDSFGATGLNSTRGPTASTIVSRDPTVLWGSSVVFQALNRCSDLICLNTIGCASGPGTRSILIEAAMRAIEGAVNGANLYIARQYRARMNAAKDPLKSEWAFEVAHATIRAKIARGQANEILRKLYSLIQGQPVERGVEHIHECYDLVNHRPSPAYLRIYLTLKEEVAQLGVLMNS
jgi:methylamine--corrinoid protein Co-methyltransferase